MSDSVRPHRRQPTRLPRPWDSPGKNTGVGCHFLPQCRKVKSDSEVAQSCPTLATPWTAAHQAPPSMRVSRQKYWSRVPLPSPSELLGPYKKHYRGGFSSSSEQTLKEHRVRRKGKRQYTDRAEGKNKSVPWYFSVSHAGDSSAVCTQRLQRERLQEPGRNDKDLTWQAACRVFSEVQPTERSPGSRWGMYDHVITGFRILAGTDGETPGSQQEMEFMTGRWKPQDRELPQQVPEPARTRKASNSPGAETSQGAGGA